MKKIIIQNLPFAALIFLNIIAEVSRFKMAMMFPFVAAVLVLLVVNLIAALRFKIAHYFVYGLSAVAITGQTLSLFIPGIAEFYIRNIITGLYLGLFLAAFVPPILKFNPFTYIYSLHQYPEGVTKTDLFKRINLILNYIWAALFAVSIPLTTAHYADDRALQTLLATLIPIALQLGIGLPLTIKLPKILSRPSAGTMMQFETAKDLLESMPFGFNAKKAGDLKLIMQFNLSGDETIDGYLEIENKTCTFSYGQHPSPDTTIISDAKLWLDISNQKVSGTEAYLKKQYHVEGDVSYLLKLNELFGGSTNIPESHSTTEMVDYSYTDHPYKKFTPGQIRSILIIDGGPRNNKFSKTTLMVEKFQRGAEMAGADVTYVRLKTQNIKDCNGCYTCWTKTPGECIYQDDMTDLRKKYRAADLIVFASPLYVFSVTSIMKRFIDRLLPLIKPYMLLDPNGYIKHPDRFPEQGEQGFVVFSAAGFPDVKHNFDGLQALFRMIDSHNENLHLMGEFFLPAAELLSQPIFAERRRTVETLCHDAGRQIVEQGLVSRDFMDKIADPGISRTQFQTDANLFWETLDGKTAYLKAVPKLA